MYHQHFTVQSDITAQVCQSFHNVVALIETTFDIEIATGDVLLATSPTHKYQFQFNHQHLTVLSANIAQA